MLTINMAEAREAWDRGDEVLCGCCELHVDPDEAVEHHDVVFHAECVEEEVRFREIEAQQDELIEDDHR